MQNPFGFSLRPRFGSTQPVAVVARCRPDLGHSIDSFGQSRRADPSLLHRPSNKSRAGRWRSARNRSTICSRAIGHPQAVEASSPAAR